MLVGIQNDLTVWEFLTKTSIHIPYDSAIPLIGIYQREVKRMSTHKDLHTNAYGGLIHSRPKLKIIQFLQLVMDF